MIRVTINGKPRELPGPTGLADFLQTCGIDSQFVAVAHNGEVLSRDEFPKVIIHEGDVLEIVRPVGGG